MLTLREAEKIAQAHILGRGGEQEAVLMHARTRTLSYGWVFFFNSARFLQTGHFLDSMVGNAPFLVTTEGAVVDFGTALPVEEYLTAYEREHGIDGCS